MKSFQVVSLLVVMSAVVAACSGSNRNNIAGRQCPLNYAPVDMKTAEKAKKTWNKGENESAIPAGTYVYQRADLIFTEKGDKGAIVHIEDSPQRGVFKTSINCVRNGLNLSNKNLNASMNAVSKMISQTNQALDLEGKEISFKVVERRIIAESKALAKPTSLEKVYEGKSIQLYMMPYLAVDNKVDYEVRSFYEDNIGTYIMSVKFKRVDNPPPKPAAPAPAPKKT